MISTAIKCATPPTTQHVAVMWTSYFGTRHKHQRQSLAPKNGLGDWWNTLSFPPFAHSDKIPFIVGVVVVFFMWKTTPCFKMSALCVQEPWLSSLLSLLSFTHTTQTLHTTSLTHIFFHTLYFSLLHIFISLSLQCIIIPSGLSAVWARGALWLIARDLPNEPLRLSLVLSRKPRSENEKEV